MAIKAESCKNGLPNPGEVFGRKRWIDIFSAIYLERMKAVQ